MQFEIACTCGERHQVGAVQAGEAVRCRCGQCLDVPSLSVLMEHRGDSEPITVQPRAAGSVTTSGRLRKRSDEETRDAVVVLTPGSVATKRLSVEALSNFILAIDRELSRIGSETRYDPMDFQVSVALLPEHRKLVEVDGFPSTRADGPLRMLRDAVRDLAVPEVVGGPVAFVGRGRLWGGASQTPKFVPPFHSLTRGRRGSLDDVLMEAAGLRRSRGWLRRLVRDLVARKSRSGATGTGTLGSLRNSWPQAGNAEPNQESGTTVLSTLNEALNQQPDHVEMRRLRAALRAEHGDLHGALEDYDRLLAAASEDAAAYAARATIHCRLDCYQKGLADFDEALRYDPRDADAWNGRGLVLLDLGAIPDAEESFSQAHRYAGERVPTFLVNRARAFLASGDVAAAEQDCDRALVLDPHNESAYLLRSGIISRQLRVSESEMEDVQRLEQNLNQAIRLAPENSNHLLRRAEVRLARHDYQGATKDCNEVLAYDAQQRAAYALRGIALSRLEQPEEAVRDCSRAVEMGVESSDVYLARAAAFEAMGDLERALEDCEAAVAMDDEDAAAWNGLGVVHQKLGALESAIADFSAAIERAPDWSLPYAHRGGAFRLREEHEEALADYQKAIDLDDDQAPFYLGRAVAEAELGQTSQARADFDRALDLMPDLAAARLGRALLQVQQGDYRSALTDLDAALEQDPDYAPALYHRGNVRAQLGDRDLAIADFDALIRVCPTLGAAYSGRANVWIQMGETERADNDYNEAIQCDPDSAEAYMLQRLIVEASFHHEQEEFIEAIARADEALEIDEECAPVLALRAAANWYSEQFVEAMDDYSRLFGLMGDSYDVYSGRGQVHAELGEFEQALDDLDRAVTLAEQEKQDGTAGKESLAYALSGRALAYAGLGNYDDADRDFERSIKMCPGNAWVHYNHGLRYDRQGDTRKAAVCFDLALQLDEPRLPPRKRSRAAAYVRHHPLGNSGKRTAPGEPPEVHGT